MKTITNSTKFTLINGETTNSSNKSKHFVPVIISLIMILFLTSCSRNVGSGCGAWPMANAKNSKAHNKYDAKPVYSKNSRQYASYKGFN